MDLAEEENFAYKHPYFLEDFSFKFEGLKEEDKENLENVVKIMGATVREETKHVLTHFRQKMSNKEKDYYSLGYLTDSMLAEQPLEIEKYKLKNLVESTNQSEPGCLNAQLILKHKSCSSFFNHYFCCKLCIESRRLFDQTNIHDSNEELNLHIETSNEGVNDLQSNGLLENSNNLPLVQQGLHILELNENHDSDGDDSNVDGQDNAASNQLLTNGTSHHNGHQENKSHSDDIEMIEIVSNANHEEPSCSTQSSRNLKINISHEKSSRSTECSKELEKVIDHEKPSCSTQGCEKLKTNQKSSIDRWKRVRKVPSDSDASDKSAETSPTRKRKTKRPRRLSSSSPKTIPSPKSSSSEGQDFVERHNHNRREWWLQLPTPQNPDPNYKEPESISKGRGRGRDYTISERQLMIAYLIVNSQIENGTGRRPWSQMHKDGYMQDRSTESLNNHYRRWILPRIEIFKLPKDLEKKFVIERKRHNITRART